MPTRRRFRTGDRPTTLFAPKEICQTVLQPESQHCEHEDKCDCDAPTVSKFLPNARCHQHNQSRAVGRCPFHARHIGKRVDMIMVSSKAQSPDDTSGRAISTVAPVIICTRRRTIDIGTQGNTGCETVKGRGLVEEFTHKRPNGSGTKPSPELRQSTHPTQPFQLSPVSENAITVGNLPEDVT